MTGDILPYTSLITSEHADKPDFVAVISTLVQGPADGTAVLLGMPADYDLDAAVGAQLDTVGLWVGVSRDIAVPSPRPRFSWGVSGLGWGQAPWGSPLDTNSSVVVLTDAQYRLLLQARIAANNWDGSVPGADAAYAIFFGPNNVQVGVEDHGDMTMSIIVVGALTTTTRAVLIGSYLNLDPDGVLIDGYFTSSVPGQRIFGWGPENSLIGGWGHGAWEKPV